jgi:hypothetical protein
MHVRKLLLCGLILALVAPFALAIVPPPVVCQNSAALCITNHFYVECNPDCTITFPDKAAEAKATGTYYTNKCTIAAEANKDLSMRIQLPTDLTAVEGGVTYTLPTDITYQYKQDAGAWSGWITKWAPVDKTLNFLHVNHKGYVWLQYKLSVVRNGLADHFGTYSTSVTITVSGC